MATNFFSVGYHFEEFSGYQEKKLISRPEGLYLYKVKETLFLTYMENLVWQWLLCWKSGCQGGAPLQISLPLVDGWLMPFLRMGFIGNGWCHFSVWSMFWKGQCQEGNWYFQLSDDIRGNQSVTMKRSIRFHMTSFPTNHPDFISRQFQGMEKSSKCSFWPKI